MPRQQKRHIVCHVGDFCQWVDGKDHFKNDLLFLGMKFTKKSIFEPKWELTQNVGTKSAFLLLIIFKNMYIEYTLVKCCKSN